MSKTYLVPYISFDGTCKEAMEFYKSCMGGKLDMMTFGSMPMPGMPADLNDKIMHAMIEAGDLSFMACDTPREHLRGGS